MTRFEHETKHDIEGPIVWSMGSLVWLWDPDKGQADAWIFGCCSCGQIDYVLIPDAHASLVTEAR